MMKNDYKIIEFDNKTDYRLYIFELVKNSALNFVYYCGLTENMIYRDITYKINFDEFNEIKKKSKQPYIIIMNFKEWKKPQIIIDNKKKEYYTVTELAKILSISHNFFHNWIKNGKIITHKKVGKWNETYKIDKTEITRFLNDNKNKDDKRCINLNDKLIIWEEYLKNN